MHFLLLIIFGLVSGVFAGMGMGGGTFLVPLLSIFMHTQQIVCQSTNVMCFVCLAIICTFVYAKNKLVDFSVVFFVSISSCVVSLVCAIFSLKIHSNLLHIIFAVFIIVVGIYFFASTIVEMKKSGK